MPDAPGSTRLPAVLLALALAGCSTHAELPPPHRVARVAQPQAAANAAVAVYPGEVHARYESALGFRVAGKLSSRRVDVGARVSRGDVLAELDPRDLELASSSARASLASATAAFKLANAEHERYEALYAKRFVSQFERDAKVNALEAARAHVDEAKAALDTMRNQAGYASLRADADGVITAVSAEAGQVVAAGQVVVVLAHEGASEVEIDVPEQQVAQYQPGQEATVELLTDAERRSPARIREIAPSADPTTRTYRVRVAFVDESAAPRLGQTARVAFGHASAPDQWVVPLSALHEKDGKPALWKVDPATREVHLGEVVVRRYGEDGVIVASGIDASQWIVTAGVHRLRDGEVVDPIDAENRRITF